MRKDRLKEFNYDPYAYEKPSRAFAVVSASTKSIVGLYKTKEKAEDMAETYNANYGYSDKPRYSVMDFDNAINGDFRFTKKMMDKVVTNLAEKRMRESDEIRMTIFGLILENVSIDEASDTFTANIVEKEYEVRISTEEDSDLDFRYIKGKVSGSAGKELWHEDATPVEDGIYDIEFSVSAPTGAYSGDVEDVSETENPDCYANSGLIDHADIDMSENSWTARDKIILKQKDNYDPYVADELDKWAEAREAVSDKALSDQLGIVYRSIEDLWRRGTGDRGRFLASLGTLVYELRDAEKMAQEVVRSGKRMGESVKSGKRMREEANEKAGLKDCVPFRFHTNLAMYIASGGEDGDVMDIAREYGMTPSEVVYCNAFLDKVRDITGDTDLVTSTYSSGDKGLPEAPAGTPCEYLDGQPALYGAMDTLYFRNHKNGKSDRT